MLIYRWYGNYLRYNAEFSISSTLESSPSIRHFLHGENTASLAVAEERMQITAVHVQIDLEFL